MNQVFESRKIIEDFVHNYSINTIYKVIIKYIDTISDEEIEIDGLYAGYDGDIDSTYNDNILVYLSPREIINLFERGAEVLKMPDESSRVELYDNIRNYLLAWSILINVGFNHALVPANDLRILNNFADKLAKSINVIKYDKNRILMKHLYNFLNIKTEDNDEKPGAYEPINRQDESHKILDTVASSVAKQQFDLFKG